MCSLETSRCFSQLPIFKSLVFPNMSSEGLGGQRQERGSECSSVSKPLGQRAQL